MPELVVVEEHQQVYEAWRERGSRGLRLTHIDTHCDMRGLLVDRPRSRAWRIDGGDSRISRPDSGNFLAHAIMEGIVTSVRWVHHEQAGRRYDTGTVKYESDLTALPHRLLQRLRGGREVALELEELSFEEWDGPRAGEQLDIDWDGIASVDFELPLISRLMAAVLEREFPIVPETTWLAFSPGYSQPDRELFEEFIERLAAKLGASVTRPELTTRPEEPAAGRRLLETLERAVVLGLKRVGIH